jgi:hypothetical protein
MFLLVVTIIRFFYQHIKFVLYNVIYSIYNIKYNFLYHFFKILRI